MSWAPRLISRSLSGKRQERVSRESSLNSMISINWPRMKSMMPMVVPFSENAATACYGRAGGRGKEEGVGVGRSGGGGGREVRTRSRGRRERENPGALARVGVLESRRRHGRGTGSTAAGRRHLPTPPQPTSPRRLLGHFLQVLERADLHHPAGGLGLEHLLLAGEGVDAHPRLGRGLLDDVDPHQARD